MLQEEVASSEVQSGTRTILIIEDDEAMGKMKAVYLAMRNISKKSTIPIHHWKPALNRFTVEFAERFPNDQKLFPQTS